MASLLLRCRYDTCVTSAPVELRITPIPSEPGQAAGSMNGFGCATTVFSLLNDCDTEFAIDRISRKEVANGHSSMSILVYAQRQTRRYQRYETYLTSIRPNAEHRHQPCRRQVIRDVTTRESDWRRSRVRVIIRAASGTIWRRCWVTTHFHFGQPAAGYSGFPAPPNLVLGSPDNRRWIELL